MVRDQLQALLRQRPFQPFCIHLNDGRSFEVRYPRINLLAQTYINIGIPETDEPDPFCESFVFVPLKLIARVEPLPHTASPVAT